MPAAARSIIWSICGAAEGAVLGRPLHLDEPVVIGHDDVEVDLGGRVLAVVEVEVRQAVHDPDADRRDLAGEQVRPSRNLFSARASAT